MAGGIVAAGGESKSGDRRIARRAFYCPIKRPYNERQDDLGPRSELREFRTLAEQFPRIFPQSGGGIRVLFSFEARGTRE